MENKIYELDFDRITSLDDVIVVLKSLEISFPENYPNIEMIRHLLKEKTNVPNPDFEIDFNDRDDNTVYKMMQSWVSTSSTGQTPKWDL